MGYSFFDLAKDTLKATKEPLSVNDIWKLATELGYVEKLGSTGKTPWQTLAARIYVDIRDNNETEFVQASKRPAKFYLKTLYNQKLFNGTELKTEETKLKYNTVKLNYSERDLHILLSTFVYSNPHFNCYTKTIYHEISKKGRKGYNKWLHPDLVGVYFPFDKYQSGTLKLLETFKENSYKLFSFEMKVELNFANLRECYFQAVSNSSWAHEGYLAALKVEDDPLLMDELRRLNNSFGIGVIRLDPKNIEQSEILFPSRNTEFLDWETIDRLIDENSNFKDFIEDLMEDIKLGKVKSSYDKVLDAGEFDQYMSGKRII